MAGVQRGRPTPKRADMVTIADVARHAALRVQFVRGDNRPPNLADRFANGRRTA